ncbi:hypothetical protein PoB_001457400 [Plakobranchus ocellatus]|uniref:Uncharacterized protein n=1 Tax=Plakobranchus ocellatus TaxID=259542 RepID=A0AAV3Z0Z0_9GAST|nr:hypothetical protein PoB_001457400 [Plakobranchus ocellatus]
MRQPILGSNNKSAWDLTKLGLGPHCTAAATTATATATAAATAAAATAAAAAAATAAVVGPEPFNPSPRINHTASASSVNIANFWTPCKPYRPR